MLNPPGAMTTRSSGLIRPKLVHAPPAAKTPAPESAAEDGTVKSPEMLTSEPASRSSVVRPKPAPRLSPSRKTAPKGPVTVTPNVVSMVAKPPVGDAPWRQFEPMSHPPPVGLVQTLVFARPKTTKL